ncbi:hypothetical protein FA15DRAFT_686089 [Coprinopsis marcescibilis]|uniref:C2H2-type domain-containing protein n=1 Tax=Coprinopsis marcescibilis TaxID=230819 RepID=A0A5C3L3A7_COPMA|nr:hypothetical protein FA15DRAFT_686089 [Coprinopsis marcescibilis]
MLQIQYPSPICSFIPGNLTLASLNARHSESPTTNTPLLYTKSSWETDYACQTSGIISNGYDFQSNSIYGTLSMADVKTSTPPSLAGLGIHCPDVQHSDHRLASPPKAFIPDGIDHYLSFSPRMEASYATNNEPPSRLPFLDDISQGSDLLWALSVESSLEASQYGVKIHPSPPAPGGSALYDPIGSLLVDDSTIEDLSIEHLSAAAGLSVEEFTAKITEGAQYALQHFAQMESLSDDSMSALPVLPPQPSRLHLGHIEQEMFFDSIGTSFDAGSTSYDTANTSLDSIPPLSELGSIEGSDWFQPILGVNPADIMPGPSFASAGPSLEDIFNSFGERMNVDDSFPDSFSLPLPFNTGDAFSMTANSLLSVEPPNNISHFCNMPDAQLKDDAEQLSDYEPPAFLSPSSSEYSPSLASARQFQPRSARLKKRKISISQCEPIELKTSATPGSSNDISHLPAIDLGSPVFDAHRGIDLENLKARAERYRLRNHGREYDKRWLLSFAGKLSCKGELIEEFRCYVVGCQQVNKRRDHILIHVGAHLDQRPFKCVHCAARFLRKNECKRHELSHTGIRPFTCSLCPYPGTTFVRQDLLRRHMKRTHHMEDGKENKATSTSRPRKKVKSY